MDINEILGLDKKAFDINYNDYQNWKCITPLQAKEAIKEIVKETLRMAAEDAKILKEISNPMNGNSKKELVSSVMGQRYNFDLYATIDKDSITNVINKIKF